MKNCSYVIKSFTIVLLWLEHVRDRGSQVFSRVIVLKNFAIFNAKQLWWCPFCRRKDFVLNIFQLILQNFSESLQVTASSILFILLHVFYYSNAQPWRYHSPIFPVIKNNVPPCHVNLVAIYLFKVFNCSIAYSTHYSDVISIDFEQVNAGWEK